MRVKERELRGVAEANPIKQGLKLRVLAPIALSPACRRG